MPLEVVLLSIRREAGGTWRLALGAPGTRPEEQELTSGTLEDLAAAAGATLGRAPRVSVPGRDAAQTRAEEDFGRRLAEVLGNLRERLARSLGRSTVVVVVDADHPVPRGIPWELLAPDTGGLPLEAIGAGVVARLAPGGAGPSRHAGIAAVSPRCLDPDDAACAERLDDLGEQLVGQGLGRTGEPAAVLHVICHGRMLGQDLVLATASGSAATGSVAHVLGQGVAAADLVVLDVCSGGHATTEELASLAPRLVASGASACLGPSRPIALEASSALARGLYEALAGGAPLAVAVADGRRAIRALARAHPTFRWWCPVLYVADVEALLCPSPLGRWRPEGWPAPDPEAASLLRAARSLAEQTNAGFVGLEHLLGALPSWEGGGPATRALRYLAGLRGSGVRRHLEGLQPVTDGPAPLGPTPRLRGLGASLAEGFGPEQLWTALWQDPYQPLATELAPDPGHLGDGPETLRTPVSTVVAGPVRDLEVQGGPEDGRRLGLTPGVDVGRSAARSGPDVALYAGSPLTDPRLSRRHLTWLGEGKVSLHRKTSLTRGGTRRELEPGELDLEVGDVLSLTAATALVAVGVQ